MIAGAPAAILIHEGDLKDGSHTISMTEYKSRDGAWVLDNLETTRPALTRQVPDILM